MGDRMERFSRRLLVMLMLTIIAWGIGCAWSCEPVHATCTAPRCLAAAEWTSEARLTIARMLYGECGPECWRYPDAAALPHIIHKRLKARRTVEPGVTLTQITRRYSAPLRGRHERARRVQSLPWGLLPGELARWNDDWVKVLVHVGRLARGEVSDPCKPAMHWGGLRDKKPDSFRRVCRWLPTRNRLYR